MEASVSRRTFLKGSAGAAALAGLAGASAFDLVPAAHADEAPQTKTCYNSCPRNCYDTCSIVSTVEDGVLKTVMGNPNNTYTGGRLCVKGYTYPRRIYSPDRIKYPMRQTAKGSGEWEQISWEEAVDVIAQKIVDIQEEDGNALGVCLNKYSGNFNALSYGIDGFFTSIGHTTRAVGTPCWPAGIDSQTFDMGTLLCSDPEMMAKSKLIIVWGANPAWNSVHSMRIIADAKERGTKVVVIDPVHTDTASKADQYIEIKASTDGALALGMCKWVLDHGYQDDEWMQQNSIGHQEFIDYVNTNITVEWAAEKTGIPVEVIEKLAEEYCTMEPACIWEGFGLQRHTNGGANVRAIDALVALTGNIGKVGAGANYGQLDSWLFNYGIQGAVGPKTDNVEADRSINMNNFGADVLAASDPKIKLLWVACRNPMSQDPETDVVRQAYESVDLVVTVDQFMNPSCEMSDIVLPCTTIFETWGVHASYWHYWMNGNEQAIEPLYEAKCDYDIFAAVAKRMNEIKPGSSTYPTDKDAEYWTKNEIMPEALEMFGFTEASDIFEKGCAKVTGYDASWADGVFRTPSEKYEFYSEAAATTGNHLLPVYREEMAVPADRPVRLINPHWKYGLHSQFQNLDWLMDVCDEPYVEMHPELAAQYGVAEGDGVRLTSDVGYLVIKAKLTETVPKDAVVVYEAWFKDSPFNVNYLVKAVPADMGAYATGMPGLAFHDAFVAVEKA